MKLILITLFVLLTFSFKDCNFTNFNFQSNYTLGKQEQLNRTFTAINQKIALDDVFYLPNSYTNYTVSKMIPTFSYLDSKQKAQIMGKDTIIIDGGFLQVVIDFQWQKKDFVGKSGNGTAICRSDEVVFAKALVIQKGFLLYKVLDYFNVTFTNNCKISRIYPPDILSQQLAMIDSIINFLPQNYTTVKMQLFTQIQKLFVYYLNNSLYNDKHQLDDHFVYTWNDTKRPLLQIQYQVLPTGVDVERDGISFTFVTQIKDYDSWQCGAAIPSNQLNTKIYGGLQQFSSLSIFKNSLKYAIQKGYLDTELINQNWSSKMFQFYAGDLYQVIPKTANQFYANQEVKGVCRASKNGLMFVKNTNTTVFVVVNFACTLNVFDTKVAAFDIEIDFQIQSQLQADTMDFKVKQADFKVNFSQVPNFKVQNLALAKQMIKYALERTKQRKVFGSGWKTQKRDYPHILIEDQCFIIYDSTHIGPE